MFAARNMMFAKSASVSSISFSGLATLAATNNAATYSTAAAYQPSANALVLAVVQLAVPVGTVTFTGNGLTWVQVASIGKLFIFRGMGASPTSTVGTVNLTSASNCSMRIVEFRNVKTSGSNGSDAVVQSVTNSAGSGTVASVTLSALTGSSNAVFAAAGNGSNPYSGTQKSGWSEDLDAGASSPVTGLYTMYRIGTTDNAPDVTGPNLPWEMIALEISIP